MIAEPVGGLARAEDTIEHERERAEEEIEFQISWRHREMEVQAVCEDEFRSLAYPLQYRQQG